MATTTIPTHDTPVRRGRPSDVTDPTRVTISLTPEQVHWLDQQPADSRSQLVRTAIDRLRQSEPPKPLTIDLVAVNAQLATADAATIVRWAADTFGQGLVLTTSFGAQAAVMLHLVTRMIPDVPVVFVDTGYLFPETYRFAQELTERLKLNLKVYQSATSPARMEALSGKLWEGDAQQMQAYDFLRKVEPMQRAMEELRATAWLSGVRREQTEHRKTLRVVEPHWAPLHKVHPILAWTTKDVHEYLRKHDLPYHPLYEKGYKSIGDWHSTASITGDAHERSGRFRGLKQECGLHVPQTAEEDQSRAASGL